MKTKAKKHSGLTALLIITLILGALAFAWFALGNMLTLYLHTNQVTSGEVRNLLFTNTEKELLPGYLQEVLEEEEASLNPVLEATLPYVTLSRQKIHGFFGASSVDYTVSAPDVEKFFMETDITAFPDTDALLAALQSYIPTANIRTCTVTVQYTRKGLLSWQGDYETTAFADAVSGGFNTAYNYFYKKLMEEYKEALS